MHRNLRTAAGLAVLLFTVFAFPASRKPWKDASVQVGDIKIHFLEAGAGDQTLVFIPGWMMNAEIWKEQIPYFSARGFRVIAYDPRSHGLTTKTDEGNTYHQHAADLVAFLKAVKVERSQTTLIGWSAGAATLLDYASSPEASMPAHFVLVDGSPLLRKETDYPAGMTPQQARTLALGFQNSRVKAADQYVRGLFRSQQGELLYRELSEASEKTPVNTALALFLDLYTGDRRPALKSISAPTLIVNPELNRAAGEYLQSRIQGSQLELIAAGSAMFLEKPQAFNQTLEAFLTRF